MKKGKTAILLLNVGTPDKPSVKYVRKYLFQFLNDRRVIDLPWLFQKILVNLIIVPFRAPKSTVLYKRLWTANGSPLLYYAQQVRNKLQDRLPDSDKVFIAMRYQNPGIRKALAQIKEGRFSKIVIIPLFPQYASSTTGTALQDVMNRIKNWNVIPTIRTINQFYAAPKFLDAFVNKIKSCHPENYDHIVFSYHGLPLRHLDRVHPHIDNQTCTCYKSLPAHGHFCYRGTCYHTTRLLAEKLNLNPEQYSVGFQSRLSDKWIKPFSDKIVIEKAKEGVKKLLFVAPSFVADCLETTVEIQYEYEQLFKEHGGEELKMVESLNDDDIWIDALNDMVRNEISQKSSSVA
ncbi:MAG: ferrochelatase [Bacteroidetes bacterium]|jgi:ferrochelatase|nr:ferrochelatase [Bacteroidota bacterium]